MPFVKTEFSQIIQMFYNVHVSQSINIEYKKNPHNRSACRGKNSHCSLPFKSKSCLLSSSIHIVSPGLDANCPAISSHTFIFPLCCLSPEMNQKPWGRRDSQRFSSNDTENSEASGLFFSKTHKTITKYHLPRERQRQGGGR